MTILPEGPVLGFVAGHLPTYYAEEHGVVAGSIAGLRAAAAAEHIHLVAHDEPVVTAEEATAAARSLVASGASAIVVLHAAFTMGDVTPAVRAAGVPVVIWTVDEPTLDGPIRLNSFVSGLMGSSILRSDGSQVGTTWLHGDATGPAFVDRFGALAGALRARHHLAHATIGFLGGVAPTFTNFEVDADRLRSVLGPRVHAADLAELFARIVAVDDDAIDAELVAIEAAVARSAVTQVGDVRRTAAAAVALRSYAIDHGCTALAVSDWSEFQDVLDLHPGMAFSWLDHTDRMCVACEGDVVGAASMVALRAVAGTGACLLDVVSIAPDRSALQLWHCGGSPFDLADEHGVGMVDHSTLGRKVAGSRMTGAVADMVLRPGPVTVLRFGNDLARGFVAEACVVPGPSRGYDGTRGWVTDWVVDGAAVEPLAVAELLVTEGVEHHVALVGGHHGAAVRLLVAQAGLHPVR